MRESGGGVEPSRRGEGTSGRGRVAVLGAGITGLTAAWTLQRAGHDVVVFDASRRSGGAIGTFREGEWLHETGPNALMENSPEVSALIEEIGLAKQRVYAAPEAKKRYVICNQEIRPMPASPWEFATTDLFSWEAKWRLLGEPWRKRAPADLEESVAEFVIRRLGPEFLDYAVNPFVGGVYAGDPTRLSVKHGFPKLWQLEQEHGSLVRGAIARKDMSGGPAGRMFSFRGGLQELPRTMEHLLAGAVRRGTRVRGVRWLRGEWEVEFETAGVVLKRTFAAVISALPPDALAGIAFGGFTRANELTELARIEHAPVASVFTGWRRDAVAHPLDGFGVLVPEVERGRVLGTLFSSTIFPRRAPDGHVALTTFVGGTRQPELAALSEPALVELVTEALQELVGARGQPEFVHVKQWPRAIPQYTLGYERYLEICAEAEKAAPGLFIGGNGRDGISLSNCIQSGRRLAAATQERLRSGA